MVVIAVAVVAVLVAAACYWGSGRIYFGLGASDLVMGRESAARRRSRQEEIRQMLEAKSARREARGEAPLDIDAEMAELTSSAGGGDPALREEVRQLVIAATIAGAPGRGAARRGGRDRAPTARLRR